MTITDHPTLRFLFRGLVPDPCFGVLRLLVFVTALISHSASGAITANLSWSGTQGSASASVSATPIIHGTDAGKYSVSITDVQFSGKHQGFEITEAVVSVNSTHRTGTFTRSPGQMHLCLAIKNSYYWFTKNYYCEDNENVELPVFQPAELELGLPAPRWYGDSANFIADPVNPVTGEFVIHATDLTLEGPLPLEIRRVYGSFNEESSQDFGYGWNLAPSGHLSMLNGGNEIHAMDEDGSVIRFMYWGGNYYRPTREANPQMARHNDQSVATLNSGISKNTVSGITSYRWTKGDGSYRLYVVRSYPVAGAQRSRPYLEEIGDAHGNTIRLIRGTDSTQPAYYGRLKRIETSAGRFVTIWRRGDGLIERITADDGRYRFYVINDARKELGAVFPSIATETPALVTYWYSGPDQSLVTSDTRPHLLVREVRPDGRWVSNNYDASRRVAYQYARVDPTQLNSTILNATFDYSVPGQTKVTDAYGRDTTYVHSDGLVREIHEPEGRSTLKEWFTPADAAAGLPGAYSRALKKLTDPRGLVTDYTYDTRGNIASTTVTGDLDGDPEPPPTQTHVVTAQHTSTNLPEWIADSATGLTTTFRYEDPVYPRLATHLDTTLTATGELLRTDRFDYTERSGTLPNPDLDTDPDAPPIPISARGLLEKHVRALGSPDEAVTDYDYAATGFRTSVIHRTGTGDPDVALTYAPTPAGQIETVTDAAGRVTEFTYATAPFPRPRPQTRTVKDETGAVLAATETTYNDNGEVFRTDGPRSGPEDWTETDYDQAGRPSEIRVWRTQAKPDGTGVEAPPAAELHATTRHYHDLFGNLVLTIDPRGHATTHQYDGLGRLAHTRRFDAAHADALFAQYQSDQWARRSYDGSLPAGVPASAVLSLESFTHHPGGEVHTHTDVLGGLTTTLYNSRGQPRHRSHPDGSVSQWRYLPDGRLDREILRDGSYWKTTYDLAARTVTRTLKKADDTELATETRVLDRRGNLVSFTDAEGGATTHVYDGLDRLKTTTGPAATTTSARESLILAYDAAGILTTATNALGEETRSTRDALGRVTREEIRDASGATIRLTTFEHAPDHHSVTTTLGTGAEALATTTYTDPAGRPLLTRFGDGTHSLQTYDLAGLPLATTDPLGRSTHRTHDALGFLATLTTPPAVPDQPATAHTTTFVHNPAGQLLERHMPLPADQGTLVAKTVFDTAGRPTRSSLLNGTDETRVNQYAYHPATHATWAGLLDTRTDPRGVVHTHTYDDYLRLATLVTDGPAPETDSTTTYTHDRRGLLTRTTRGAPSAGPPTEIELPRDTHGRPTAEIVTLDEIAHSRLEPRWDAAGRRDRLTPTAFAGLAPALVPGAYTFAHRADGLLAGVAFPGFSATHEHGPHGLLRSTSHAWLRRTIDERDELGRIQEITTSLAATGDTLQTETQAWHADGTLDSYSVSRPGTVPGLLPGLGAWDETRDYAYDGRGRVTGEDFSTAPPASGSGPGQIATLAATFDHGAAGPGIRTDLRVASGAPAAWQSRVPAASDIDVFARVTTDQSNAAGKLVPAHGASLGADFVELWVNGSSRGRATHPGWADNTGAWSATLPLDAGAQTLHARAAHPSGAYTATAANTFGVAVPLAAVTTVYDADGNVTSRSFADGRTQTLAWDAFGQLVKVAERDSAQNGHDWSAAYDAFGRRLRTVHQPVVAGAASGSAVTVLSLYDPAAEFLEIAVVVDGVPAWKVHGPDLDGAYGGWNGTGGLEAVLTPHPKDIGAWLVRAAASDGFGNIVAVVSGQGPSQKAEWLPTRVGGYGPLPNHRAQPLTSADHLVETLAWRTRRIDPTGFYWLGARYYEPHSGRFLSPDPFGHSSDMSLYAFAHGDPVNFFDPDGRFGKSGQNPYPNIFRDRSTIPIPGYIDGFGAHASFCMSCHDPNNPGARLQMEMALNATIAERTYAQVAFMWATAGLGELAALRTLGQSAAGSNAARLFPQYMRFRGQGFTPAQAKYLAEPYKGMGHHFIPRRSPLPEVIIENPANIMGRGMLRGRFYERHFLGDPYFHGTAFPRSIGGTWSGDAIGLVKPMRPVNWWYAAPDWLRVTGGVGAAAGGGAAVYYMSDDQ